VVAESLDTTNDADGLATASTLPGDPERGSGRCDSVGVGDACDNCWTRQPEQQDCDADGIGDTLRDRQWCAGRNMNGIPDSCDVRTVRAGPQRNGKPDECEINGGTPFCFGYSAARAATTAWAEAVRAASNSIGMAVCSPARV